MSHRKLTTQENAVLYFIENLDVEMVDTILDNDRNYQDLSKPIFIHKLGAALDSFMEMGDTFLSRRAGQCQHKECNYLCRGYSFTGNQSNHHMDLIVETNKEGKVLDLYECSHFLIDGEEQVNQENTRVRIDILHL